jgi:uncharacterized protein YndB with AHSA1/START domain
MFKKIALVLLILIAAVLIYAATLPDSFRVERSIVVNTPPERVFALVNDLHQWKQWSPFEKKDPDMSRGYGPVTSGKGATYAWSGNGDIGKGSMEIVESIPARKILIALHFVEPFEGRNSAEFGFLPETGGTRVTWAMYGPSTYVSKLMGMFFDMDSMIGKEFEAGLADLKAAAEKNS